MRNSLNFERDRLTLIDIIGIRDYIKRERIHEDFLINYVPWQCAVSFVIGDAQNLGGAGGTSTGIDTSGADFILVGLAWNGNETLTGPTDNKSNSFTALTIEGFAAAESLKTQFWYVANATVGSNHTISASGVDGIQIGMTFQAFSGVKLTSPLDQEFAGGNVQPGTTASPGTRTPSEDNCLLVSGCAWNGSVTSPSIDESFTTIDFQNLVNFQCKGIASAYLIQTSAAAVTPDWTWTGSVNGVSNGAIFKSEPGGGGGVTIPMIQNYYRQIGVMI